MITHVAFDADDTLWHNETLFTLSQERFRALLAAYADLATIDARLYEVETRNLSIFGYGIKGFTLSMIETAIELTEGRIDGHAIHTIIGYAREMVAAPIQLLDHAETVVRALAERYQLLIITKGDLLDQESKIARSGLAELFAGIEIVSNKDAATYRRVLARHGITPASFVMVGNALRSDILPVRAIGARAVHVPYVLTWAHEHADAEPARDGYAQIADLSELPKLLTRWQEATL